MSQIRHEYRPSIESLTEELPSKSVLKSITPDSVKALMVIEAIIVAFFAFWLANEYYYNVYFRIYIDNVFLQHLTSYTIAIGLGMGLAGTAVAAALYKTMREAKVKLESVAPKIKGSVEKLLTNVPTIDSKVSVASTGNVVAASSESAAAVASSTTHVAPATPLDEKK